LELIFIFQMITTHGLDFLDNIPDTSTSNPTVGGNQGSSNGSSSGTGPAGGNGNVNSGNSAAPPSAQSGNTSSDAEFASLFA
jgi:hypothetical protein